jgi:hypothetical protein
MTDPDCAQDALGLPEQHRAEPRNGALEMQVAPLPADLPRVAWLTPALTRVLQTTERDWLTPMPS